MVASKKKKAGKGKGSKTKARVQKEVVRDEKAQEAQNLLAPPTPPAPEPQALPATEVTDPQVSNETKGD